MLIWGLNIYSSGGYLERGGVEISQGLFIFFCVIWYVYDTFALFSGINELREASSIAEETSEAKMALSSLKNPERFVGQRTFDSNTNNYLGRLVSVKIDEGRCVIKPDSVDEIIKNLDEVFIFVDDFEKVGEQVIWRKIIRKATKDEAYLVFHKRKQILGTGRTKFLGFENDALVYDDETKQYYLLRDYKKKNIGQLYPAEIINSLILWQGTLESETYKFSFLFRGKKITDTERFVSSQAGNDMLLYDKDLEQYYLLTDFTSKCDEQWRPVDLINSPNFTLWKGVMEEGEYHYLLFVKGEQIGETPQTELSWSDTDLIVHEKMTKQYYLLTAFKNNCDGQLRPAESLNAKWQERLILAAKEGDVQTMKSLADKEAIINAKGDAGMTALMHASRNNHVECVKILLSAGADVKMKNEFGRTALKIAKEKSNQEIVEILKRAGAE